MLRTRWHKPLGWRLRNRLYVWDVDTGSVRELTEARSMLSGRGRIDTHREFVMNMARLAWVSEKIKGRVITAGNMFEARDRAVEAYVRMKRITTDRLELVEGVAVIPDYEMIKRKSGYRLVFRLELWGSEPQTIESVVVTDDSLCFSTEKCFIQFPIQLTEQERSEMASFREMTRDMDPLANDDHGA